MNSYIFLRNKTQNNEFRLFPRGRLNEVKNYPNYKGGQKAVVVSKMFENVAALLECNLHRFWQASEEAANCGCKMLDNLNPVLKHPVSVVKKIF